MGLGDVYLTAMIGAFVSFPFIIPAIFVAALAGAVLGRKDVIVTGEVLGCTLQNKIHPEFEGSLV